MITKIIFFGIIDEWIIKECKNIKQKRNNCLIHQINVKSLNICYFYKYSIISQLNCFLM